MQESTIPLITAVAMLGIITLLFFVNEFFRKYKIVKKKKHGKRKRVQKIEPTIKDLENAIDIELKRIEKKYHGLRESKVLIAKKKLIDNPTKTVLDKIALDIALAQYYSNALKKI